MQFKGNTYLEEWSSKFRNGKLNVTIQFERNGRIVMNIAESTRGPIQGYCGADTCHVEGIATNGARYEQTLWFNGDEIRKFGSETSEDKTVMWESTLTRPKDGARFWPPSSNP